MTSSNNPNLEPISIPISHSGAYLYQAPHVLQLTVDKELAIVFCLKNFSSTGLVLYQPELSLKDLLGELELLHLKLKSKLKIHTSDISLKLFGLSTGALHVVEAIQDWANQLGIKIVVTEIGKRINRNLSIDCRSGVVGVTYGDLNTPKSNLIFISQGTPRNRIPLAQVHNRILILTENAVQRQLTKAAVEEHPAWAAQTVENVPDFFRSTLAKKGQWSVVLLFEDIINQKGLESFISEVKKLHPSTEIRWVGSQIPSFLSNFNVKLLPPMDYDLLPDFKKMLKRAVFDANLAMNFESAKIPKKIRRK